MRSILLAGLALAFVASAAPAHAADVDVNGSVALICQFNSPPSTVSFTDPLNNPTTGAAASRTLTLSMNTFCNGMGSTLEVASVGNGLRHSAISTAPPDFAVRVNYDSTLSWNGGAALDLPVTTGNQGVTTATPLTLFATDIVGVATNPTVMTITTLAGLPPLATQTGQSFTDTLTFTLTPLA